MLGMDGGNTLTSDVAQACKPRHPGGEARLSPYVRWSPQVNEGIAKLSVGRPEDDAAIVPVVSESSAKFVEGLVQDAKEKGATLCQEYKREVRLSHTE